MPKSRQVHMPGLGAQAWDSTPNTDTKSRGSGCDLVPTWSLDLVWLTDLASLLACYVALDKSLPFPEPRFLSTGHGKSLRWHLHQCLV